MPPKKAKKAVSSVRKSKSSRRKPKNAVKMFQYSEQQMMLALAEVKNNNISVRDAAKKFNVPKTTLNNKARGFYPVARKMGPKTCLDTTVENKIVKCLFTLAEAGFPLTKTQLLDNVSILASQQENNPFKNDRPTDTWFKLFCARHPALATRVAQNISRSRANVTEGNLREWFERTRRFCEISNCIDALADPKRIYNLDETAFFLSPEPGRVMAKKGAKTVYNVTTANDRQCTTVLMGGNAAGELAPSMIVFKNKIFPKNVSKNWPKEWGIGISPSGWMTARTFAEYLQKIFYPELCRKGVEFPVVVFVDGHSSHFSFETQAFCEEKKIILIALYPNSTHLMQPMDVAIFGPLKKKWRAAVHEWKYKNHSFGTLTKEHFAELLQKVIFENVKPEYFVAGFRTSGLYPFSADGIDYGKLVDANVDHEEAENEAEERETVRKKYEIAYQCISEMLSSEKEVSFFQFHARDPIKSWDLNIEDTLGYNLWRMALEKSQSNIIPPTIGQCEDHQLVLDEDLEIEELHSDWIFDPEMQYTLEDADLQIVDEIASQANLNDGGMETLENVCDARKIHVLENTIVVPARQKNINAPLTSVNRDFIQVSTTTETDGSSTPSTHLNGRYSIAVSDVPTDRQSANSANDVEGASKAVSMSQLYGLPSTSTQVVDDIFLQCLKPAETKIKNQEKFCVPRIKDTTVVSSGYHQDYLKECKEKHEEKEIRRQERAHCKATKVASQGKNSTPRKGAKQIEDFIVSETPESESDEELSDEYINARTTKKRRSKHRRHSKEKSRKALNQSISSDGSLEPNALDSSFNSDISIRPKRIRKPKRFLYNSDE